MIDFEQTPSFNKKAKKLAAKYPSFKNDLEKLMKSLVENPEQGVLLADNCGARVITANCIVAKNEGLITLVLVYDKNEIENVSIGEIREAYRSR